MGGKSAEQIGQEYDARQATVQNNAANQVGQIQNAESADLARGAARGQQLFGDGSLGRVDANRSGEVSNVISQRQQNLQGYTPEEQNAMKSDAINGVTQGTQASSRQLRAQQAQNGVRGATAVAQQNQLQMGQQSALAGVQKDLFLKNIDQKRAALGDYENSVNNANNNQLQRQEFNIQQANNEKQGQLATEMGYGALGSGDRSAALQQQTGSEYARQGEMQLRKGEKG